MRFVPLLGLLLFAVPLPLGAADKTLVLETAEILEPFAPLVMDRVARAGIDAEVRYTPFVRLLQDLANGTVDGAFFLGESFLKASTAYEAVPVPLYRNEYLAVTLADGPDLLSPKDLRGLTVAYPRGYTGMAEAVSGAEVTTVVDEEQGFRILGAGRVQVLIVSRTSTQMFGAVAGKPIRIHEPPVVTGLLYLVLRRSFSQEKELLTTVFRQALQDGSWERDVAGVVRRQTVTR